MVLAVVTAVLVLVAAIVVPLVVLGDDERDGSGGPGGPGEAGRSAGGGDEGGATADLSEVETYQETRVHVPLGDDVDYDVTPPAGGDHWGQWLDCGVYDEPVRDEFAVHDLEHGTVWITYDPDLPDDDVARLADELPQNGIMSPYPGLPAPVVVTVWNTQLRLTGADDPRLPAFVEEYDGGVTAPEPFASCAGGDAPADSDGGVSA